MADDHNAAQEVADDLLTDPDKDARTSPPPAPPQTIDAEPSREQPGTREAPPLDDR